MALETLKDVEVLGGYSVMTDQDRPLDANGQVDWDAFDKVRQEKPVSVDHEKNMISFKIQDGPIKEHGINGCQVDTLVWTAKKMVEGLNAKFPCRENALVVTKLEEAIQWLQWRTRDRVERGVEGKSQA